MCWCKNWPRLKICILKLINRDLISFGIRIIVVPTIVSLKILFISKIDFKSHSIQSTAFGNYDPDHLSGNPIATHFISTIFLLTTKTIIERFTAHSIDSNSKDFFLFSDSEFQTWTNFLMFWNLMNHCLDSRKSWLHGPKQMVVGRANV